MEKSQKKQSLWKQVSNCCRPSQPVNPVLHEHVLKDVLVRKGKRVSSREKKHQTEDLLPSTNTFGFAESPVHVPDELDER